MFSYFEKLNLEIKCFSFLIPGIDVTGSNRTRCLESRPQEGFTLLIVWSRPVFLKRRSLEKFHRSAKKYFNL